MHYPYCLLILYSYLLGYSFCFHYQLIAAIREVVLRETNALTQVHTPIFPLRFIKLMILLHGAMPLHAQVFISIDTQNTGKLTLPMMVELLQRYTQYPCNS